MKIMYRSICFLQILISLFFCMPSNAKSPRPLRPPSAEQWAKTRGQGEAILRKRSWVWGGASLLLIRSDENFRYPEVDYQWGFASRFNQDDGSGMFYGASFFDFAYMTYTPGKYTYINSTLLFGYEKALGTPYLSFLIELGPGIGYRGMMSRPSSCALCAAQKFVFNGMGNLGFNLNFNPDDDVMVSLRVVAQMLYGTEARVPGRDCKFTFNMNQPTFYLPSVGLTFAWR